jgi:hypothetical protein
MKQTTIGSPVRQYSTTTPIKIHQEIDTESLDFLIAQGMQDSPTTVIKQIPEEINETILTSGE